MENVTSQHPDWLRERYRFDAAARSKKLEVGVVDQFRGRSPMRILDVGAGLGANTRYYANLLHGDQEWTLVEQDTSLAGCCVSDLSGWAESNAWDYGIVPEGLEIRQRHKRIAICVVATSMFNLEGFVDLSFVDLAMANAVFDLLSEEQFLSLMGLLTSYRLPILATINYRSMHFQPQEEDDFEYIGLYERHMRRHQDFGFAMGPNCSDIMIAWLQDRGYEVRSGESIWIVTSADRRMMGYMLTFMQSAISGLLATSAELAELEKWVSNKLKRADRGQVALHVEHTDVYGSFQGRA